MTSNEPIKYAWQSFAEKIMPNVPINSPPYRHMKNAFFSGAFVVIRIIQEIGDNEEISEDRGVEILELIKQDVDSYLQELKQRQVEKN